MVARWQRRSPKTKRRFPTVDELRQQYDTATNGAERFADALSSQLDQLLSDNRISLGFPIQYRVKTFASFSEKLERRGHASVSEISDLVGIRLILQFRRDIERACNLVSKNFNVVERQDSSNRLTADHFGYASVHYIITLDDSWHKVPTFAPFRGMKAEIQIRTTAQHIWAAASHTLQYKHEGSVPLSIRRSIHRVAALLETVDLEFERVLEEREKYVSEITPATVGRDSKCRSARAANSSPVLSTANAKEGEAYAERLQDLAKKILTANEVVQLIAETKNDVLAFDAEVVAALRASPDGSAKVRKRNYKAIPENRERLNQGVYFTHCGLLRKAMEVKFGK